ncbi:MAG: helicase-exonuclease AddAB subunit AddA [Eubacteriales bacterium]|nr:helicase-exonuclease AddAB subunit AddA [Eubacteriales bacterium]
MNWTTDQKKIIDSRNCNLLVSAAAGSGKTAVLVERMIQMISDDAHPMDVDQLLVVTFTKAAAAQMKEKIASAIEKKLEADSANEHLLRQVNLVNRANIMTIDSFCYKVVKEHFYVLGLDPNIRVGDTGEMGLLREEVLEKVMEEFYQKDNAFCQFSDAFSADKKDDNVADYILKLYDICSSYPRPEEWTAQARNVLLVQEEDAFDEMTVVKKLFDEMHASAQAIRERIVDALSKCRQKDGPIHLEAAFLSDIQMVDDMIAAKKYTHFHDLLETNFARIGRGKKGTFDEDLAEELKKLREDYKKQIRSLLEMFVLPFSSVVEQMQKQAPMMIALLDAVDAFRARFLEEKLAKNILEFSDVEHCALKVLCAGYDEDGNAIPSAIGKEMAADFVEIMIDEYQDSNFLQEAILRCVSTVPEGKNNIFMVGDVKQSIYRFRMARPDLFMDKYHTYALEEGSSNRKLLLKNNFRSRANVLEGINYLFYQIMGADLGGIDYTEDEALIPGKTFLEGSDDSVELLIGETKDFEFLRAEDEMESAQNDEQLNDELEDIGKKELEATMVANRILDLMQGDTAYQVVDEQTGEWRNLQYRDIVILFRAPSSYQQVFYETLMAKGIPVLVQNENGYFDTIEIRLVLSLLRVLDNPYNDVEFAAVLRSYFGGCNSNELTWIVLLKRKLEQKIQAMQSEKQDAYRLYLYDVIKQIVSWNEQEFHSFLQDYELLLDGIDVREIEKKCSALYALLNHLISKKEIHGIGDILSEIYMKENYYFYVKGMPEGGRRARNLELFLQEAQKCEVDAFCSVFDFLRYVEKLQKKSISLGGDPGIDTSENVVRMMSIHKSKGLEFPVVFLSGIGKTFNQMDTKTPIIIHPDYYIGAKYRDTEKRRGNDTFLRKAMVALTTTENIAEELRILYVAMTRAKEKLIMTGVTSDVPALVKRYEHIATRKEEKLSFANVKMARSYLDLIVMGLMRNEVFEMAMKQVRKRMDKKGEAIISAEYERKEKISRESIRLKVEVFDYMNLIVQHLKTDLEKENDREYALIQWQQKEACNKEPLSEALHWNYHDSQYTTIKSKLSVTEIKRIYETDFEPSDVIEMEREKEYVAPLPKFLQGDIPMDRATQGTWVHKTMELVDFGMELTKEQLQKSLTDMIEEGRIPKDIVSFFSADKIYTLLQSSLGKRMQRAAKLGLLCKEKQFIAGVPAHKIMRESRDDENDKLILVQGIIDAYFQEEDYLVLLDYKTDFAKLGEEEKLVKRYATQLMYYKDTLEQLTGLKVKESYIYAFALDKAIEIK